MSESHLNRGRGNDKEREGVMEGGREKLRENF